MSFYARQLAQRQGIRPGLVAPPQPPPQYGNQWWQDPPPPAQPEPPQQHQAPYGATAQPRSAESLRQTTGHCPSCGGSDYFSARKDVVPRCYQCGYTEARAATLQPLGSVVTSEKPLAARQTAHGQREFSWAIQEKL